MKNEYWVPEAYLYKSIFDCMDKNPSAGPARAVVKFDPDKQKVISQQRAQLANELATEMDKILAEVYKRQNAIGKGKTVECELSLFTRASEILPQFLGSLSG